MVERQEVEDTAKVEALRAAARAGAAAIDRGAFVECADAAALVAHLDALADGGTVAFRESAALRRS